MAVGVACKAAPSGAELSITSIVAAQSAPTQRLGEFPLGVVSRLTMPVAASISLPKSIPHAVVGIWSDSSGLAQ